MTGLGLSDADLRRLFVKAEALTGAMFVKPRLASVELAPSLFQRCEFPLSSPWRGRRPSLVTTVLHGSTPPGVPGREGRRSSGVATSESFVAMPASETHPVDSPSPPSIIASNHELLAADQGDSRARCRAANMTPGTRSDEAAVIDFTGLSEPADEGTVLVTVAFLLPVDMLRTFPTLGTRIFVSGVFSNQSDLQEQRVEMHLVTGGVVLSEGALCNLSDPSACNRTPVFRADVLAPPGKLAHHFVVCKPQLPEEWVVLPAAIAPQMRVEEPVARRWALLIHPPQCVNVVLVPPPECDENIGASVDNRLEELAREVRASPRERSTSRGDWVSDESAEEVAIDAFSAAFRSTPVLEKWVPKGNSSGSQAEVYSSPAIRPMRAPPASGSLDALMPVISGVSQLHDESAKSSHETSVSPDGSMHTGSADSVLRAAVIAHKKALRRRIAAASSESYTSHQSAVTHASKQLASNSAVSAYPGLHAVPVSRLVRPSALTSNKRMPSTEDISGIRAALKMGPAPRGFDPSASTTYAGGRVPRRVASGAGILRLGEPGSGVGAVVRRDAGSRSPTNRMRPTS